MSSKIPYLNEVWNPITGCSGTGCATKETCWAREMVNRFPAIHTRFGKPEWSFSTVRFHPDRLDKPLHWRKPRRVGVCFMGDLFDEQVQDEWIWQVLEKCTLGNRRHTYFFLTKQAKRMADWFDAHKERFWHYKQGPYIAAPWPDPCLWWGVSCCTQADVDRMVPDLLRIPGKKWISLEPMMGPIDLNQNYFDGKWWGDMISLVIIGCHSTPRRYPCKLEWVESVVEQCKAAGVPVYVKQLDIGGKCVRDIEMFPKHLQVREMP